MISLISLIMLSWLITLYMVYDDGPKDLFKNIRYYLGVNKPITDIVNGVLIDYESDGSWSAEVVKCHRCFGFWCGLIISIAASLGLYESILVIAVPILIHEVIN